MNHAASVTPRLIASDALRCHKVRKMELMRSGEVPGIRPVLPPSLCRATGDEPA